MTTRTTISWSLSSWNPSVGCDKVSEGCRNCYAETMVSRPGLGFGHPFNEVRLHPERLAHVRRFKPVTGADGRITPHLVFVNSMSDLMHDAIPDAFVHQVFDVMEANPQTVFQVLSKRAVRARRFLVDRFGGRGIPQHIWFGFTVETNEVAGRLKILRTIKERVGGMVTMVSVEPIVGPTDKLDFDGIAWVITGGESGPHARIMQREWLLPAIDNALACDASLYHKQSGRAASHPNLHEAPPGKITERFAWLVANGWELLPGEKGGATVDKELHREFPQAYYDIARRMNDKLI